MNPLKADHIKSSRFKEDWPETSLPEFAFIGRSNVGKSSLINMLVGIKGLARTSGTPGKTQNLEHFNVEETWYLADLPGYGYAKVSKSERAAWIDMMRTYMRERENLVCVMQLIDIRIKPQQNDLDSMRWMGENQIPFAILFTKSDKLKKSQILGTVEAYKQELREAWDELPVMFITSASTGKGREQVLEFIDSLTES
jgi:GTP-binding protein